MKPIISPEEPARAAEVDVVCVEPTESSVLTLAVVLVPSHGLLLHGGERLARGTVEPQSSCDSGALTTQFLDR